MIRLNILISNDDGIHAPGIIRLAQAAKQFGNVTVVAPAGQCSAMSQKLTIYSEMEVLPAKDFPVEGVCAWSVSGSPADCIKVALEYLSVKPDVIFSGINNGYNTGLDIAYSGTCGACFEAIFNGIPAIAFSTSDEEENPVMESNLLALAEEAMHTPIEKNAFWNINFPNCSPAAFKGILRGTLPAKMQLYKDNMVEKHYPDGRVTIAQCGIPSSPEDAPEGTDVHAVLNGYISFGKVFSGILRDE